MSCQLPVDPLWCRQCISSSPLHPSDPPQEAFCFQLPLKVLSVIQNMRCIRQLMYIVYAKTNNLMTKRKWCIITHMRIGTMQIYAMILYTLYNNCPCIMPYPGKNEFLVFLKDRFSKRLERFCSMLLLCITTMVWTLMMLCCSFWNECYKFAPNSKSESAREDRETYEWNCYEKSSQDEDLVVRT